MDRSFTATRFEAERLALLDDVARTGDSLVITKRGQPVARVVPVQAPESLRGSVTFEVSDEELVSPSPTRWDAATG